MAFSRPNKITSWSISRYNTYTQCPLKLKLGAIDRIKEPQSPAMTRGDKIHTLAASYIRDEFGKRMPAELVKFKDLFIEARKKYIDDPITVDVEDSWAFRKDWTMTRWDDWNGCWLRVKVDHCEAYEDGRVHINDWKTGKYSPEYGIEPYVQQLDLYATAALVVCDDFGDDLKVIPRLRFLDHGETYPPDSEVKIYTSADLPQLQSKWVDLTKPLLSDTIFAPKPNRFCYNCHYRADNKAFGGGQCKY